MTLQVQLSFDDGVTDADRALVRQALRAQEVVAGERGPGVLVVNSLRQGGLEAQVGRLAAGGRRHLVLTLSDERPPGAVWKLLALGAGDVVSLGSPSAPERVAARLRRWSEVDARLEARHLQERLVGTSHAWRTALEEVVEAAMSSEAPVLLLGESGTGKELAARLLHELDPRPEKQDLVVLDCTTIVPGLSGSEFFGHERGAFTDAVAARDGAFGDADQGTLFLDELGELPLGLQAELLRVIQDRMYKRVGSGTWRHSRFRLVCATHRDLRQEVERGRFRADLYHRIAAWTIRLPPLRDRREDIPLLAAAFARDLGVSGPGPVVEEEVLEVLRARDYPGNVRELKQLVARMVGRHVGPAPLGAADLPPDERPERRARLEGDDRRGSLEGLVARSLQQRATLKQVVQAARELAIAAVLEETDHDLAAASRRLGVTRRALELQRAKARRTNGEASSLSDRGEGAR